MTRAKAATELRDETRARVPDIIARIKDSYPSLRPAEQSVANAVLSDLHAAVAASNADIAIRAGVSEPSVTRFCRAIGCDGVRDFKLQLARSLVVGDLFLAETTPPINANDSRPPFWTSVLGEAHLALREVERQLDPPLCWPPPPVWPRRTGFWRLAWAAVHRCWPRKRRTGCSAMVCRSPPAKTPIWRG